MYQSFVSQPLIAFKNIYHRQSTSVINKNFESRKLSPATQVFVAMPQRRSQQLNQRSNSPSSRHNNSATKFHQATQQSQDLAQRLHTQGQSYLYDGIKQYQYKQEMRNSSTTQSQTNNNTTEKLSQTKTTIPESVDDERTKKTKKKKDSSQLLQLQKQLLDRELFILQLQRENKSLKDQNKRYLQLEKEQEKLKKENKDLKIRLELLEKRFDNSPSSRQSDFISALTENDRIKLEQLLNLKNQ